MADVDPLTLAIGSISLAAMVVGTRWLPAVPMALVVVLGSIAVVALFGLDERGVDVLGVIEGGFPTPALPIIPLDDLFVLVPGAIALAVLGYAETNQVAESFAEEHDYEIRPDQELFAVGGSNILSSLVGGFIVAGGASQSAASDKAGARSQVMGLLVAGLAVLTMLALLPLFQDLPQAALAAIVISAVVGFLRVDALRRLASLRRSSIVLALIALFATIGLGILAGLITVGPPRAPVRPDRDRARPGRRARSDTGWDLAGAAQRPGGDARRRRARPADGGAAPVPQRQEAAGRGTRPGRAGQIDRSRSWSSTSGRAPTWIPRAATSSTGRPGNWPPRASSCGSRRSGRRSRTSSTGRTRRAPWRRSRPTARSRPRSPGRRLARD